MVCYDEFTVYDKPSCYYGWAVKNTRPLVKFDQKQTRVKLNGLLSIDVKTGDEFLSFSPQAKSEDIAAYFLELAKQCIKEGYKRLSIIFDWAKTHQKKMRTILYNLMKENELDDKITVDFDHTAKYSPILNLAEYAIHALRQRFWHHLPDKTTWAEIKERIYRYLEENQIFTMQQVQNTLKHIYSLIV